MTDTQADTGTDSKAYATARQTAEALEGNPLGMLVGGLAIGAVLGALLPRSTREREALAPVGRKLNAAAMAAVAAAREAGRAELDAQGITRANAKDRGRDLLDGLFEAASAAGNAAAKSVRPN